MRGKPPKIVIVHFRVIQQWPPWCRSNHYRTLGWCMANLRRREKIIGVRRTRLCAMRSKKCRRSHRAPRRTGPVHGRKVKWIDTDFVFTMSLSCYNIDGQWSAECSERRFKCATSRINLNKIRRKMYDEANVVSGFFFLFPLWSYPWVFLTSPELNIHIVCILNHKRTTQFACARITITECGFLLLLFAG